MSSTLAMVVKRSTRCPAALSRLSNLSTTTSLPQLVTRCSPSTNGGPGSAPSKRYGWLHTFLRCMTTLWMAVPPALDDSRPLKSRSSTRRYQSACMGDRGRKSLTSFFGGSPFSTSALSRRSITPCRSRCSRSRDETDTCPALESNERSKGSDVLKMSGKRKLSSAHSSCRLFWMGVPVSSSRFVTLIERRMTESFDSSFLSRCASSTTRKRQRSLRSAVASDATHSYVVTSTWKLPAATCVSMMERRSSLLPCSRTARRPGHHRSISLHQLPSTVSGTTTR
mmetsp:Transcript_29950/g.93908  ORF Transcript_29950/g.93908 Transcript_29950/m.93908 type:complete len:282 (+) Transcript_29950:172-1017(+)